MKFNTSNKNINKTVNRSGHVAYVMEDKEHLVTAVLTTMFGEAKFYGSTDNDIVKLATECAKYDPDFLYRLTCYARREFNMRSVSHVLTCVIAHEAREYTKRAIDDVVLRADDITEIMSCYLSMYGKPFPNALKRGIAQKIQQFDEYQIAKYNGGNKAMKFADVLRIVHPTPINNKVNALFGKILSDTLETPYTWETELSARGNTKEVWDELISSGKVGYMALLRNLRNIIKCGANVDLVLSTISNEKAILNSKQLPFRFYSAYKTLEREKLLNPSVHIALEKAIETSTKNIEKIPGKTLIAVDVSGSMDSSISAKSDIKCMDVASLMGAMAGKICEDATIIYFSSFWSGWGGNITSKKGYTIGKIGKYDSILTTALNTSYADGGTDMSIPMNYALDDSNNSFKVYDRVIYLSDNECNSCQGTIQSYVDEYRRKYNKDFWVHAIDLQGYGTQQFCGKNFNLIAGWNEKALGFINLAEQGLGNLVKTISEYDI